MENVGFACHQPQPHSDTARITVMLFELALSSTAHGKTRYIGNHVLKICSLQILFFDLGHGYVYTHTYYLLVYKPLGLIYEMGLRFEF